MNSWFINRKAVRNYALAIAGEQRSQGFTRVSDSFVRRINGLVRRAIEREIEVHPSVGKTLK